LLAGYISKYRTTHPLLKKYGGLKSGKVMGEGMKHAPQFILAAVWS